MALMLRSLVEAVQKMMQQRDTQEDLAAVVPAQMVERQVAHLNQITGEYSLPMYTGEESAQAGVRRLAGQAVAAVAQATLAEMVFLGHVVEVVVLA